MGKLKSSYVKEVLIKEYGDDIGFHETPEKNKSEFVNNTKGGSNYIKAVSDSFGITDDQSILNLAPQLSKHIRVTFTKLVSNCGTVAGRRKSQSTSVETTFHNEKEKWP